MVNLKPIINDFRNKFSGWEIKPDRFPWILLGICLVAYGTFIWDLGFYWDDWEILYLSKAADTPSEIFLYPFRPLRVLMDIWLVELLGYRPIYWHILMLVIRYLGGLVLWQLLREVWPNQSQRNAWVALIFVVYPSFLHHSMAVIYNQMFISVLLYLVSVWLMVRAYKLRADSRKADQFWVTLLLSLVTGITNLFVTEYLAAMELWRPAVLLILAIEEKPLWKYRIKSVVSLWLPYLFYMVAYGVWRLTYVKTIIDDPNRAVLLDRFIEAPVRTFMDLIQNVLQDTIFVLVTSWGNTLQPDSINLLPSSILIFGIVVICVIGLALLMPKFAAKKFPGTPTDLQVAVLGIYGLILGLIPAWLIGRNVFSGRYNTRFSIPALVGASLVVVAVVFYLIPQQKRNVIVLSVLVGLSVSKQIEMTNIFRWDWVRQERVFWQIQWRAPEISSGTALLANKAVSGFSTTYPVGYAINLLHSDQAPAMRPEYWWFEIYSNHLDQRADELRQGSELSSGFHDVIFSTGSHNSLLFDIPIESDSVRCVWMLTPLDENNTTISAEMQSLAGLANLDLIKEGNPSNQLVTVFGEEPKNSWCYFYQKAQLAQQQENWNEVMRYYEKAADLSLSPSHGYEYIPFIVASISLDDFSLAQQLTITGYKIAPSPVKMMCAVWQEMNLKHGSNIEFSKAYFEIRDRLGCTQ